jgi:hypothetical protein
MLDRIGKRTGIWDVFAGRDGELLFADVTRQESDRLTTAQIRWLEAALSIGIDPAASGSASGASL